MAFLDYSGLSHFLDKIKAMTFQPATSSTDGDTGLVPAPLTGDEDKFLKGNGTWDSVPDGLPEVTSSDNGKILQVVNGEWDKANSLTNIFNDISFSILTTDWTGSNAPYTATVSISSITADSYTWVFYGDEYEQYALAKISSATSVGQITFTTSVKPTGTITGTVRVANKAPMTTVTAELLNSKLNASEKGAVNGVASLDSAGKVSSTQLPDMLPDVTSTDNGKSLDVVSGEWAVGEIKLTKNQGTENAGKFMKVGNDGNLVPEEVEANDFVGATASSAGVHGFVPAPTAGDQDKFLKGDGTWIELSTSHAAFVENDVDILTTDWVAGTNVYTYTYTNSAILSDTLIDVFYKDGAEDVLQSKVSVSKAVGSVILTVETIPTGTLPITIRLIQNTDSTVVTAASTTQAGIVQLSDSVSDTSTTKAATSSAVKSVNDKLGTVPSGQTLQGQIDTVSSNLGTVPLGKTAQGEIDTLSGTVGTVPSGKTVQGQIDTLKDETVYYGTCSETAAATAQKAVSCSNFPATLKAGQKLSVKFTNANTASNPTLKVNSLDAKSIVRYGSTVAKSGDWKAGEVVNFMFDGTNWIIVGGGIHDDVDLLNSNLTNLSNRAITPVSGVTITNNGLYQNSIMVCGSMQLSIDNTIPAYGDIASGFGGIAGLANVECLLYNSTASIPVYIHGGTLSARNASINSGTYFLSVAYFKN